MPRNKLHVLVDIVAYLVMACLAATGLIMYYRLPPGSGSLGILGYSRHQWGTVHFYLALALIGLVVLHVALHWKWVRNSFGALVRPRAVKKAGAGVGGVALLLVLGLAGAGLLAAPWLFPIAAGGGRGREGQDTRDKGYRGDRATVGCDTCVEGTCPSAAGATAAHAEAEHGHGDIRGSSTLAEAAAEAGVSAERLAAELGLPAGTPPGETLGRLRQQHGFTMQQVRAAVARLKASATR